MNHATFKATTKEKKASALAKASAKADEMEAKKISKAQETKARALARADEQERKAVQKAKATKENTMTRKRKAPEECGTEAAVNEEADEIEDAGEAQQSMSLEVEIPELLATDEQLHNMRINPSPEVEEETIPEEVPLPEVDQAEKKKESGGVGLYSDSA